MIGKLSRQYSISSHDVKAVSISMNDYNQSPAPYGDGRPVAPNERQLAPWCGSALALLILALVLFLGAVIALVVAVVQLWITLSEDTGVDIGVGIILVVFVGLVLSGCAITSVAYSERRR
ncbi:hypothetical protein [Curtobacterium sp. L1-20]|uniref:hypothetical protein n=1 Tax=Curtobacterium sp. L1-20 TaxID=3138181 RepID=UPI003B5191AB